MSNRIALFLSILVLAAVPASPSQKQAVDYRVGEIQICSEIDDLEPDAELRCRRAKWDFQSGEAVCAYTRFQNPRKEHRHRVVAYRDGREVFVRNSAGRHLQSWRVDEEWWAYCEPDLALPGDWRFELYVDVGHGYEFVGDRRFAMHAESTHTFAQARTCESVEMHDDGWRYECLGETERFLAGQPAYLVAEFENVVTDHQFLVKTYRDGKLIRREETDWNHPRKRWEKSYFVPVETDTVPGKYRFEFFINTGSGYQMVGARDFEVEVLSPVDGPLRMQCFWPEEGDVWAFCKHRPGYPHAARGVAASDDDDAWDINLRDFKDRGKTVYPAAPGRVVRYGNDEHRPGRNGAAGILLEHETPGGEKWWSGYLHMRRDSLSLIEGQLVDIDTPIGRIGATGSDNSHLHFVIYRGENKKHLLKSFDASIRARDAECRTATFDRANSVCG